MSGLAGSFNDDDRFGPVDPLSERELDALDAEWKPLPLLAAVILGGSRMSASVERYLEWRERWNAVRGAGYSEGPDPYDDA